MRRHARSATSRTITSSGEIRSSSVHPAHPRVAGPRCRYRLLRRQVTGHQVAGGL
jgi:hypothetical protein